MSGKYFQPCYDAFSITKIVQYCMFFEALHCQFVILEHFNFYSRIACVFLNHIHVLLFLHNILKLFMIIGFGFILNLNCDIIIICNVFFCICLFGNKKIWHVSGVHHFVNLSSSYVMSIATNFPSFQNTDSIIKSFWKYILIITSFVGFLKAYVCYFYVSTGESL